MVAIGLVEALIFRLPLTACSDLRARAFKKNELLVSIEGPRVLLEPDSAQAIAVTLHELATNAAKHGALSATQGQIEVKWSHTADGRLILLWTETGGPPVKTPTRQGFGGEGH